MRTPELTRTPVNLLRTPHPVCGMISGFAMTVVSSPVDVIKTRYMNAPAGGTYAGVVDCLVATIKADGLGALYKV